MSVNSKMTAIADKIRALLGVSGKMGLDAMATNLGTEQTNVANAFTSIGNKGGTVPSSKVSGNLASAINSIPEGVTITRKSGTLTTNTSGKATVNCGFKPDLVAINGGQTGSTKIFCAAMFTEGNITSTGFTIAPPSSNYIFTNLQIDQNNTGFSVIAVDTTSSFGTSAAENRQIPYVAMKYT